MKKANKHMTCEEIKSLFQENFPNELTSKLADFYMYMRGQTFGMNEKGEDIYYATDINNFLKNVPVTD